jgi:hypothetical protein
VPAEKKEFYQHNQQRYQEHENGDPVNAMHVFHPLGIGLGRIFLFDIKVFR